MVLRPEQFTEQAQEVLHNSEELVRRYHHGQWDVEHVLLALLELERGLPAEILAELGISQQAARGRLHQILEKEPKRAHGASFGSFSRV
jgi:ATP-dependent Clp protease ATP-binding subunit ClpC